MNKKIVLKAVNIHKTYTSSSSLVSVLSGVSLEAKEGEAIAIVGKSGEGKSTLLHILGTLEKKDTGELEICGLSVENAPFSKLRNEHIGFLFQSFNLLEECTVLENVLMPLKIARKPTHKGSLGYKKALELLEQVGLSSRAHFLAKLLSGGEKQRTALARALCNDPSLILADEPSGNLDSSHSQAIYDLLFSIVKKERKTLIVVTHDGQLASRCDRVFLLKDGLLHPCISDMPTKNLFTSVQQEPLCIS